MYGFLISIVSFNHFYFLNIDNTNAYGNTYTFISIICNLLISCMYKCGLYRYTFFLLSNARIYILLNVLFLYSVLVTIYLYFFKFNVILSFSAYTTVNCLNFIVIFVNKYVRHQDDCFLITSSYNCIVIVSNFLLNTNTFNMSLFIVVVFLYVLQIFQYFFCICGTVRSKEIDNVFVCINECVDNVLTYIFIIIKSIPSEFVNIYYLLLINEFSVTFKNISSKHHDVLYKTISIVRIISFLFFLNVVNPFRCECNKNVINSSPTCVSFGFIFLLYTNYICYHQKHCIYQIPKTMFIICSIIYDVVSLFLVIVIWIYFTYK